MSERKRGTERYERWKAQKALRHKTRMHTDREYRRRVKHAERLRHKRRLREDETYRRRVRFRENLRQYHITPHDYELLVQVQGGRCAICRREPVEKRLGVDHDHKTGYIRGLLCHGCNVGLGHFNDRPDLLRAALDYLLRTTPGL